VQNRPLEGNHTEGTVRPAIIEQVIHSNLLIAPGNVRCSSQSDERWLT
jgi:hypothetical protein